MRRIQNTRFYSKKIGALPKGCQLCVQGRKMVLYITGLCSQHCYFCPLSDQRKDRDLIWANEWQTSSLKNIIAEATLTQAKGSGITGGDPLVRLQRTLRHIKALKKHFGKNFHIHLYTPLNLVTENTLKKLFDAGLDEIRFHPNLDSKTLWHKISLAKRYGWDIGVEIPAIPEKKQQTIDLIEFIKDKVDFLNINELEISDTNAQELLKKGYIPKDNISYGVKGSETLALRLLAYCQKHTTLKVHYCSTKLKDKVQLANRLKLRAEKSARPYDIINRDSTLTRAAIYLPDIVPGFGYRRKLESIKDRKPIIRILKQILKAIVTDFKIPKDMIEIDKNKLRILTHKRFLKRLQIKNPKAIVTEYPTHDQMEVEIEFV